MYSVFLDRPIIPEFPFTGKNISHDFCLFMLISPSTLRLGFYLIDLKNRKHFSIRRVFFLLSLMYVDRLFWNYTIDSCDFFKLWEHTLFLVSFKYHQNGFSIFFRNWKTQRQKKNEIQIFKIFYFHRFAASDSTLYVWQESLYPSILLPLFTVLFLQ